MRDKKFMKVYELAKKLEVKSVFLMDKIRKEWKLPVRTHMESLTPEMAKKIEKKFYATQRLKNPPLKKTKKPVKKLVKKTRVAKKKPSSSTTKKSTIKKQSSAPLESPPPIEEKTKQQEKPSPQKKIIIRRKAKETQPVKRRPTAKSSSPKVSKPKQKLTPGALASSKSIRMDLVSVKSRDPLDESFWDKTEEEEKPVQKQPKKPLAEKDLSSKFHATDFRKREVIFQPRKKRMALTGDFKSTIITTPKSHKRVIKVYGEMSIENLCKKMGIKRRSLIKKLKEEGVDFKELSVLDFDTIALIVPSFGFEAKNTKTTEEEILKRMESPTTHKELQLKPPVVTVMGHVDHGKTTLLDKIRKTKVAEGESGGITQHIGAYSVSWEGKPITFIDTPGHEAFTAIRSRGVQVTDIVVLLVSAVDGVQPQTLEALNHAQAGKSPVIIAISKMDAPGANPDKIKKQLADRGLTPEDWGGDTSFIPISSIKGEGIKELLEQIQILAELQELKYQSSAPGSGVVLEARKDKGSGAVVSLLLKDGTLKTGQHIVAGEQLGKVRQMKDDQGKVISTVRAGFPVEVMGFSDLPQAGDSFCVVTDSKTAKNILLLRRDKGQAEQVAPAPLSPEELLLKMQSLDEERRDLNLIVKADREGSLEALKNSLEKLPSKEVSAKVIHSGTGAITESDVLLAFTVSGIVLGFNVRPDGKTARVAKEKSVDIHTGSVIYKLLDQVRTLMLGLLKDEFVEEDQGSAEVREIFHISKAGTVAGCYVTEGQILRSSLIRLVRDGRVMYDGALSSLKRFKDDVQKVGEGLECGMTLKNFNDIKPKDILSAYTKKKKIRTEL